VRAHVLRQSPTAYAPKELVIVHALPRLPGGKVDRRGLTTRLLETTTG
jgi:O-succinylbenzoic acid--CoA ligase